MFAPAGQQPHEQVCLQTGGARCAPPSARPAALPLLQLCLLCAGAGFICPGHVSFDADFSFCSVGRGLDPSAELPKNACRGEHCSPVPVCFARKPSRKMRCGGKWAGDQWSPYTRNKAGMQFFDGLRSGQDRSLQISRQRCGGYNKVDGNKNPTTGGGGRNHLTFRQFELESALIVAVLLLGTVTVDAANAVPLPFLLTV